jgi:thymidylate synthase
MEEFDLELYTPDSEFVEIYNKLKLEEKLGTASKSREGSLPVLYANGRSLAEAWENSLICLWKNGCLIGTEYDKKIDGTGYEPPSKDSTMILVVDEPLSEPMIHRAFPGGLADLEEYKQEVLDGIKDHWKRDPNDTKSNKWEYTYHERYAAYKVPGLEDVINQYENMVEKLATSPISRRAQMVTWQPWIDSKPEVEDPPCWQSLWARLPRFENKKKNDEMDDKEKVVLELFYGTKGTLYFNANMRFRSRDAFDAAFMNDFAFIHLADKMAKDIAERRGEEVKLGRFLDMSDSYHIYGKRIPAFVDGFIKMLKTRPFEERTWTSEFAQPIFDEAKPGIEDKIRKKDEQDKLERGK